MEEPVDVAPDNKELPVHHRVVECEKVPGQDKRPASPRPNARTSIVLQPLAAVAERRPHIPAATSFTGTPRRMLWRRMSILTSLRPEGPHAPVVSTAQGENPNPSKGSSEAEPKQSLPLRGCKVHLTMQGPRKPGEPPQ